VHIPALLRKSALPDPPRKPAAGAAPPLRTRHAPRGRNAHTLHLPPGTTTQNSHRTAVQRDYATFASQYSAKGPAITASAPMQFSLEANPAERAADYNVSSAPYRTMKPRISPWTAQPPPLQCPLAEFPQNCISPKRTKPNVNPLSQIPLGQLYLYGYYMFWVHPSSRPWPRECHSPYKKGVESHNSCAP